MNKNTFAYIQVHILHRLWGDILLLEIEY